MSQTVQKTTKYVLIDNGIQKTKIQEIVQILNDTVRRNPGATYRKSIEEEQTKKKATVSKRTETQKVIFTPMVGTNKGPISVSEVLSIFASRAGMSSEIKIKNSKSDSGALTLANLEVAYMEVITMIKSCSKSNSWVRYLQNCFTTPVTYGSEVLAGLIRSLDAALKSTDSIEDSHKVKMLKDIRARPDDYVDIVEQYLRVKMHPEIPAEDARKTGMFTEDARKIVNEASKTYLVQSHEGKFVHKTMMRAELNVGNTKHRGKLMGPTGLFDMDSTYVDVLIHNRDPDREESTTSRPAHPVKYYQKYESGDTLDTIRLYLTQEMANEKKATASTDANARAKLSSVGGPVVTVKTSGHSNNRGTRTDNYGDKRKKYALRFLKDNGANADYVNLLEVKGNSEEIAEAYNKAVDLFNNTAPLGKEKKKYNKLDKEDI